MRKTIIEKWQKFWFLEIIKEISPHTTLWGEKIRKFLCNCICWNLKEAVLNDLKKWSIKSCWCLVKKWNRRTHWMRYTRFYRIFIWMKTRCNNPNHIFFKHYWWKWIQVDFKNFEDFKSNMYNSYLEKSQELWELNISIDRIDNNKNYNKQNCRWIKKSEQHNNQTTNKVISYNWVEKILMEWCDELWLKYSTSYARLQRWWSIEKTFNK